MNTSSDATLVNNYSSDYLYSYFPSSEKLYIFGYYLILQFLVYYFIHTTDHLLCKYYSDKARWFQIHSFVNLFVCIFSISDIMSIIYDVNEAVMPLSNHIGGTFAVQIHLYHTLNFPLTTMDIYHHISSVFLCFPPSLIFNKKILALFYFIGTGLPGGIDYFLLTLVKNKQFDYLREKKYNSNINAYIRMPGGAICSFLTFNAALNNPILIEKLSGYFLSFIVFTNTAFFGKMAIENYVERVEQYKIKDN